MLCGFPREYYPLRALKAPQLHKRRHKPAYASGGLNPFTSKPANKRLRRSAGVGGMLHLQTAYNHTAESPTDAKEIDAKHHKIGGTPQKVHSNHQGRISTLKQTKTDSKAMSTETRTLGLHCGKKKPLHTATLNSLKSRSKPSTNSCAIADVLRHRNHQPAAIHERRSYRAAQQQTKRR